MQYEVIQLIDKQWIKSEPTDIEAWAAAAGFKVTGYRKQHPHGIQLREELVGAPLFDGLYGPMYGGPGKVRYESPEAYDLLSR